MALAKEVGKQITLLMMIFVASSCGLQITYVLAGSIIFVPPVCGFKLA
jgi:hypothetical protein